MFRPVKALAAAFAAVAALAFSTAASALVITLTHEFSGGTSPEGTPPWVTINIIQGIDSNTVNVRVTNNLIGSEFIDELYLNLDPNKTWTWQDLNITARTGPTINPFSRGEDAFKADGDGFFDLLFDYPQAPPADRFGTGDVSSFSLTYTGPISPEDFNFISVDGPVGKTGFLGAAHIQSIGEGGNGSGWIANNGGGPPQQIPEPGSLALLGGALMTLFALSRRRKT